MMARNPRAPVPRKCANSATARSASSVISNSTLSKPNNLSYWRTSAFFGSTSTCINASSLNAVTLVITGRRPINSGIMPNFKRSSGITLPKISPGLVFSSALKSAVKPKDFLPILDSIILSNPAKAPPTINNTLLVSIWINSWWGCFLPPWGGTDAVVPSKIFNKACCTPSPLTSRVIDGFSLLRAILSISSM